MSELLGRTLRDEISGLTGIAHQYSTLLGGSPQYSIQPMGDGKEVKDAFGIDVDSCVLVDDGPSVMAKDVDDTVVIELGDKVEDIISGFTGIATCLTTFINGCVYVTAVAKGNDDLLGKPKQLFSSHTRFKVVEKNAFGSAVAKAKAGSTPKAEPERKPPGGPNTRSMRPG